jgi:hypothetical protein
MYVQSVTPEVLRLARIYIDDGLLTLIHWPHLPIAADEQVRVCRPGEYYLQLRKLINLLHLVG